MSAELRPRFPQDALEEDRVRWVNVVANMRLLAKASSETVETLIAHASFASSAPGERLIDASGPADKICFLVEGKVRILQEHNGQRYTPKILVAPAHFGEVARLGGLATHQSTIEALTKSVSASVPIEVFEAQLREDHALALEWLYSTARQYVVTIDYLRQNVFGGVLARIANVLLSYAEAFGTEIEDGWIDVGYELSYAVLAGQAACTRRAAINTMNALQQAGVARPGSVGWAIKKDALLEELLPGRLSLAFKFEDDGAEE